MPFSGGLQGEEGGVGLSGRREEEERWEGEGGEGVGYAL